MDGSPWFLQILSTASAAKPVGNPTDGSPWFFQILSTASGNHLINAMDADLRRPGLIAGRKDLNHPLPKLGKN